VALCASPRPLLALVLNRGAVAQLP
jgi:hypothetical protein